MWCVWRCIRWGGSGSREVDIINTAMTAIVEQPQAPRLKKWTQEEYLRLVEQEAFGKQRVYLFRGDIIEMPPQSHPHQFAIMELDRYLHDAYKRPYRIRIQLPFITPGD